MVGADMPVSIDWIDIEDAGCMCVVHALCRISRDSVYCSGDVIHFLAPLSAIVGSSPWTKVSGL